MKPTPSWGFNLVLSELTRPPFKQLASCSLIHLSVKVLVTITSPRQVDELIHQGLAFYLQRTKSFRKLLRLSTRAKAALVISLWDVPLTEICKAATWHSVCIFMRHYTLLQVSSADASLVTEALQSSIPQKSSYPPLISSACQSLTAEYTEGLSLGGGGEVTYLMK